MSNRDFYLAKLELLNAIADRAVKYPTMPVQAYLQEAENLYLWVQEDEQALRDAGLDWDLVTDMPARLGAFRYAESLLQTRRAAPNERVRERKRVLKEAQEVRNALLRGYRHWFRKRPDMQSLLRDISRGKGSADLTQDLSNLNMLSRTHGLPPLVVLTIDPGELARRLAGLAVGIDGERQERRRARDIRDRAFTHLKEAVDEVRAHGKHRFFRDPDRLKGYASPHFRRANAKARAAKTPGPREAATPQPLSQQNPQQDPQQNPQQYPQQQNQQQQNPQQDRQQDQPVHQPPP